MLDVLGQVVAAAYRALAAEGLVTGTSGNVSVADHDSATLLITGAGLTAREADATGVALVDLATGAHLAGPRPSSELPTHLALARIGHAAVVHAHAPHATALGLLVDGVPCVLAEQALRVGGDAPVVAYAEPGSAELAEALAAALPLGGPRAAVLRHHGIVAVGPDVATALGAAFALEEGARVALLAGAPGAVPTLPEHVVAALAARGRRGDAPDA